MVQLGLLSHWQSTMGIVHLHLSLLTPCVNDPMRVAFFSISSLCASVCVCVSPCLHTRGGTAEITSIARNGRYQIKMQANLMPRDQHRHTWPIRQVQTRCARERERCDDATHLNGRTTKAAPPQMPSRLSAAASVISFDCNGCHRR